MPCLEMIGGSVPQEPNPLASISEDEWITTWKKLRLFAHTRYRWVEHKSGVDVEDVIQKAIVDTIEGRRRWPHEKTSLFFFLAQVVRSEISHRLARERKTISLDSFSKAADNESLDSESTADSIEILLRETSGLTDNRVEDAESRAISNELNKKLFDALARDEELVQILKLLVEGLRPIEIAETLGLSVEQIRAAQKRLRRRLLALREEMTHA
jgi:RNA polymerase sigma factor (sigma-70 family)